MFVHLQHNNTNKNKFYIKYKNVVKVKTNFIYLNIEKTNY